MPDIKQRAKKYVYACIQEFKIAEFIGEGSWSENAKESIAYAIKNAEKEYCKAIEELTAREAKLVAGLKTIIVTGDKVSMIKTAKTTLKELDKQDKE